MDKLENKETDNKEIYDENNGLYYTKVGDYYYPNIAINDDEKVTLGKYGSASNKVKKSLITLLKRIIFQSIMTELLTNLNGFKL